MQRVKAFLVCLRYGVARQSLFRQLGYVLPMAKKSTVVIGSVSRAQLCRIRRLLQSQPDIEIAGPVSGAVELLLAVREMNADAVILPLQAGGAEPSLCGHLLAEYPDLLVLAVSEGEGKTFVFSQAIAKRELFDGDEGVLRAIRLAKATE